MLPSTKKRKQRVAYARKRAFIREYRQTCFCLKCGGMHNIEFHHPQPETKHMSLRARTRKLYAMSWDAIIHELLITDPLCGRCHRKEHRDTSTERGHGYRACCAGNLTQ